MTALVSSLLVELRPSRLRLAGLRRALTVAAGVGLALAGFFALHRLADQGWPLAGADLRLVAVSISLLVVSLFIRVAGWQRLFAGPERPDRPACLASAAVAGISSAVVPCKLDYALKVWLLRRLSRRRPAIEAVVVSICVLGLVDAVVLTAPAGASAFAISAPAIRGPLILVALFGLGCGLAVVASRRLPGLPLIRSSRRLRSGAERLSGRVATVRQNGLACLLLTVSLWVRAGALLMLLGGLGISFSLTAALTFICLTAGSAFVPIPSFGLGAGTAALGGVGIGVHEAAQFALATSAASLAAGTITAIACGGFYALARAARSSRAA